MDHRLNAYLNGCWGKAKKHTKRSTARRRRRRVRLVVQEELEGDRWSRRGEAFARARATGPRPGP